ncbi:MAG: hypothetical protein P4L61_00305 [Candidatus Pacebacteria bacterium]|nr:hypothetical protein [Candidatus Paceibacterota bacterium]
MNASTVIVPAAMAPTIIPTETLRGFSQTCRVLVIIDEEEQVALLSFGHQHEEGRNTSPIKDRVYLEPQGWCDTDRVKFVRIFSIM